MPNGGRRGRTDEAAPTNHERWLLTYADLITLLLAFFVILYALANVDVKKFEDLRGSLQRAFNVGVLTGQASRSVVTAGTIQREFEQETGSPLAANLRATLEPPPEGPYQDTISIYDRPEGVAVSMAASLLFLSGSAELTPEGIAALRQLAEPLRRLPNDLRVEGHTDNVPPGRGRYPTNWELSTARAVAIVRFLQSAGIPPQRLAAAGFADQRPITSNATARDRALNRRAEIIILNPTAAPPAGPAYAPGVTASRGGTL